MGTAIARIVQAHQLHQVLSFSSNEVVGFNISTTTMNLPIIKHLTLMCLWVPSLLLPAKGEESFNKSASSCISDAMRQDTDASPCNSIKAGLASNLRNQFLSPGGFNRQQRILQCQWMRRRYSQHLREVTADVMRFSVPCLSYTSATLSSMKGDRDYVYKCSLHGSLWK